MTTLALDFLDGIQISLSKIPRYPEFEGDFFEPVDKILCGMILDNDENLCVYHDSDGSAKHLSSLLTLRSHVYENIKKGYLTVKHYQNYGIGRFYSTDNISLIPVIRQTR